MNPTDFYELLKILVSIISSFFAAFFASSLALKNTKKEKIMKKGKIRTAILLIFYQPLMILKLNLIF